MDEQKIQSQQSNQQIVRSMQQENNEKQELKNQNQVIEQNKSSQQYNLPAPTKNPQEVFPTTQTSKNQNSNNQNQDNKSQTSQKSNHSIQRKRKGSFLENLQHKQQEEEQKFNQKKKADQKSVFLQNVDYKVTKQQLEIIFQDCAKITRITILKNPYTNHPKGCAYISFETQQGAQRAIHLSGVTLRNRVIKVHKKRTNLPGIHKKQDLGMNIFGMMQNMSRNTMRGRGRGRGRGM